MTVFLAESDDISSIIPSFCSFWPSHSHSYSISCVKDESVFPKLLLGSNGMVSQVFAKSLPGVPWRTTNVQGSWISLCTGNILLSLQSFSSHDPSFYVPCPSLLHILHSMTPGCNWYSSWLSFVFIAPSVTSAFDSLSIVNMLFLSVFDALTFHLISPDPLIQYRDVYCRLCHNYLQRLGFGGRAQENDPDFTCPFDNPFGANLWLAR